MKTLEVLRKSALFLYETPEITSKKSIERVRNSGIATAEAFADEIQKEIDRYYLPRPLFEDGEPAQFGDEFADGARAVDRIYEISYCKRGVLRINGENYTKIWITDSPIKRPPEPDTQEKINGDLGELLGVYVDMDVRDAACAEFSALFERQRKLDGVEQ